MAAELQNGFLQAPDDFPVASELTHQVATISDQSLRPVDSVLIWKVERMARRFKLLAPADTRRSKQRLVRCRLATPVLAGRLDLGAEFGRGVPRPTRVVEHATRQRDQIGLS